MPRNQKDSQIREDEEERDDVAAPRVDENEVEDEEERVSKRDEDADEEVDEDAVVEDLDLDDLSAMEGPDA